MYILPEAPIKASEDQRKSLNSQNTTLYGSTNSSMHNHLMHVLLSI